jgi:phosphatidylethanolamine/phosphatidyl-N-methylethanolamine N-methyltransferase
MGKARSTFLREFLKRGNKVGSVAPSSRFLVRKMVAHLDLKHAKVVVELGPGEGCITREIVKRLGPDTHLFVFEMNTQFVEEFLLFDNPHVHVINDSAEHIRKYVEEAGFTQVDYIISSLPLTIFPVELKEKIISEAVSLLKAGGIYRQYQYSTSALKLLKSRFTKVKLDYTPFNIPPAFVYTCSN